MPVTIIALESPRVLGFLVGHPARRLLTGPVSHPVVKVAARSAHGGCREVAPPTSPLPGGESAAGSIRRQLQLHLRHVAIDPHHVVTAHDRIHRIGLARERLAVRARDLCAWEEVPAPLAAWLAVDHAHRARPAGILARRVGTDTRSRAEGGL